MVFPLRNGLLAHAEFVGKLLLGETEFFSSLFESCDKSSLLWSKSVGLVGVIVQCNWTIVKGVNPINRKIFSDRLRGLRQQEGLNQPQLAKALNTSKQRVNNWEVGVAIPALDVASGIADLFDVSLDYLVGRSDDPARR